MNLINIATPPGLAKHWERLMSGEYDAAIQFAEPPVVLDLGGNIGVYAVWARKRWPDCEIHIYEPNPKAHRLLEKNCAKLTSGFAITKAAVLGSVDINTGEPRADTIRLFQGANNLGEASIYADAAGQAADFVDVPVTFAKDLPECDVLKADCEGPEREIIAEYLQTHEPPTLIAVEYHSVDESVLMQRLMDLRGYRLIKAQEYDWNHGVIVWRHDEVKA